MAEYIERQKMIDSIKMRLTIRNSDGSVSQPVDLRWADALNKLADYEDAEEQGLLVRLPCKEGDTVYYLTGNPILANGYHFSRVESTKCDGFYFDEKGLQICLYMPHGNHGTYGYFGKTVFLTREEAEAALKGERENV